MSQPKNFSRRQFVKGTLAFALGAPFILPSHLHGARRITPSGRINIGFIGLGKQGGIHLGPFLGFDDVQIVGVCDVAKPRRDAAAEKVNKVYARRQKFGLYKGCDVYNDYRDLLARKDLDAVLIATPDHWHTNPALDAIKCGLHVYCEKPLTHTIREARLIADAARQKKISFQTGSQQRTENAHRFKHAVEFIRSGRIGRLQKIVVTVGSSPKPCDLPGEPTPEGYDWNLWLGPAPLRDYNEILCPKGVHNDYPRWRDYTEYGGGRFADWGAHHFDIAQWAMDMDASGPTEIIPPAGDAEFGLVFKYRNGVEVHHEKPAEQNKQGIEFHGTEGRIYVERGVLESTPGSIVKEPLGANEFHLPDHGDNHRRDWLNAIRTGNPTVADAEIGAHTAIVCHLGNIAYRLRRPLKWDPKHERFIRDEEANKLRDKDRRAPWKI
jgi:predicted dehydrogenase